MGLRKFFNIPAKKHRLLIAKGIDKLKVLAKEESDRSWSEQSKRQSNEDGKCPNCGGKTIVNKIARVEGKGYVGGSFSLGFGSVYGSSNTDTNEVNHCNGCGNQWKKYKTNYKWTDDIIADWLNDLNTLYEGRYTFSEKVTKVLKDIPAESIWKEFKRLNYLTYYSTQENLSLRFIRKHFKSVYN